MKIPGKNLNVNSSKYGSTHTDIFIDPQIFADKFNFSVGVLNKFRQSLLNALNLLRDGAKNSLLKSIELVETPPCPDLTKTNEYPAHCLEIEGFVATEYENKSPKLYSKSFY